MSSYLVSARKYRPQLFSEVVGQDHVTNTLSNALKSDQLAHAYLFCGPRGVGKTTCARILAKVINSNDSNDQEVNLETSFNIIELDAASNNSVDHIRSLVEQVRIPPQTGNYKVFIIDEVHMLSPSAFNAFLKTLEEPPAYAIFILATTEKHKILPTILSRCQVFDFKRIQEADIIKHLQDISNKEEIKVDQEALQVVAQKADGSLRDALSIYDKISSTADGHVTYKHVISHLNILDYDYYFKLVDAILTEDLPSAFLLFDEIISAGFDVELTIQGLSQHMRDLLVSKFESTIGLLHYSEDLKSRYLNQARACTKSFLLSSTQILSQCDVDFLRSNNKRLLAETNLSKLVYLNRRLSDNISPEKKTPELKVSKESFKKEEPQNTPPNNPKEGNHSSDEATTTEEHLTTVEEVKVANAPGNKSKVLATASLTKINELREQIQAKEAKLKANAEELTEDGVKEQWDAYTISVDSQSIKSALKTVEITIEEGKVLVYSPTKVMRDLVQQESKLISMIREKYHRPDLQIHIKVDVDRFPDHEKYVPKKMLTNKEKYDKMVEKNPLVEKLRKAFELKIDNG